MAEPELHRRLRVPMRRVDVFEASREPFDAVREVHPADEHARPSHGAAV